ncbi:MAG TPA: PAS domain S-box protein, partial [Steroidobacteraceae bacterium]|nr:PAS domain S-box protein [Steroidobacteraceae bacterium]
MTAANFKLRYAGAAFLTALLAAAAVAALLIVRHQAESSALSTLAEQSSRERVAAELRARAQSVAAHAADSVAGAVRAQDAAGIARRLQPFLEDPTVTAISVDDRLGGTLYSWERATQPAPGAQSAIATVPVRLMMESFGAATPGTLAQLSLTLEQTAPVSAVPLTGELAALRAAHARLSGWLALLVALGGGGAAAALAWRALRELERPVDSIIRSAERIGVGDYSRPLEVRVQDPLAALAQAFERMRGRLRHSTISKNYLQSMLNSMTDAVFITSPDGIIRLANSAAYKLLGFSEEELVNRGIHTILEERERAGFDLLQAAQETRETVVRTRAGQTIPVSFSGSVIASADPQFQGSIFVARNITDRKRAERRIRYLARYDALTKIPNRMQFYHVLQQTIARALRAGQIVAVLYLDMDRFK